MILSYNYYNHIFARKQKIINCLFTHMTSAYVTIYQKIHTHVLNTIASLKKISCKSKSLRTFGTRQKKKRKKNLRNSR